MVYTPICAYADAKSVYTVVPCNNMPTVGQTIKIKSVRRLHWTVFSFRFAHSNRPRQPP